METVLTAFKERIAGAHRPVTRANFAEWEDTDAYLLPQGCRAELLDGKQRFEAAIISAEGTPIPLSQMTRMEEPICLTVRVGKGPSQMLHYCFIDILAGEDDALHPIAHYDWELRYDYAAQYHYARGNKNRHGNLPPVIPAHCRADRLWSVYGFEVLHMTYYDLIKDWASEPTALRQAGIDTTAEGLNQEIYRGRGLGRLMIAVSAVVLEARGYSELEPGTLSTAARRSWDRFVPGITEVPPRIPTRSIAEHPFTEEILSSFRKED